MYAVIQQEAFALRSKGFRVVYLGDFNGHVGNKPGEGIIGNAPGVNPNGRRLLNFLSVTDSVHINGYCRVPGDWSTRLSTGLWTRQRGGHRARPGPCGAESFPSPPSRGTIAALVRI